MTLRMRLWLSAGVSALMLGCLWCAIYSVTSTASQNDALISQATADLETIGDLQQILAKLNAPGNNVLETWDPEGEQQKLELAKREFSDDHPRLLQLFATLENA